MTNDAADVEYLSKSYGLTPDPWQRLVLEAWCGRTRADKWASLTCGLAVPRQNGKNGIIEMRELFGMTMLGEKILHSAHEVKTARKAFTRLRSFFENERKYPELAALVVDVRQTNGQEAILLANGGSCEFVARSKNSGRGFTVDVLVMDEAQEMSEDALEALMPTTSSAPLGNPQWIFAGTPPGPSAIGEVFTRVRNDGVEGKDKHLCWQEWSAQGMVNLDDRDLWYATNPSLGGRLQLAVVDGERSRFSDDGFARERLGMWETEASKSVVDPEVWRSLADTVSVMGDTVAFAVDISPWRDTAAIAVAGPAHDEVMQVEIAANRKLRPGGDDEHKAGWVLDALRKLRTDYPDAPIVLDKSGPAGSLLLALEERDIAVTTVTSTEMKQACGAFYDAVMERRLRHLDDPRLNTALMAGRRRTQGDAWVWQRKDNDTDITPLVASTLALWGFAHFIVTRPTPTDSRVLVFRR